MKEIYWVYTSGSIYQEPDTIVSVWETLEDAESEAKRLNDIERRQMQPSTTYEVESIKLNVPGTAALN